MLNKLLLVMLIAITLNASGKEIIQNINSIYTNEFYDKLSNLTSLSLDNYENNSTQKKVKEDFEKILPLYLSSRDIFTKLSLEELEKNKIDKYKVSMFISISLSYIKYLESERKHNLSAEIMTKNLIDMNNLMINSNNMIDYIIALTTYSKVFSNYENPSKQMISILKKYPPASKSIYIQKVEADKKIVLNMIDNMNFSDKVNMENYDSSDYKKLMKRVRTTAKLEINTYYSEMVIATTSQSKLEIEKFNKYISDESDNLLSTWNQIKLFFHVILAKFLQIFIGYNSQYDYMAEFMGHTLALVSVPHATNIYGDHIKMEETYMNLLK